MIAKYKNMMIMGNDVGGYDYEINGNNGSYQYGENLDIDEIVEFISDINRKSVVFIGASTK